MRQLLRQIAGHLRAIGFVAAVFNFLKGLCFQVKLAHAGDRAGLLIAKRRRRYIKNRCQIVR
jgi:hypothetical protein